MAVHVRHLHVSPNRVEGSLEDCPLDRLLDACHRHLITGTIQIRSGSEEALIELRAGAVQTARAGDARGAAAVARARRLERGMYELSQRLPGLDGALGDAAQCEGELAQVPLTAVMRHCEDHALTCSVTVLAGADYGEIRYRAGEIAEVRYNGAVDEDAVVALVKLAAGRFRVALPPLKLDIAGWPTVAREPTVPFRIQHLRATPAAGEGGRGAAAAAPPAGAAAAEPARLAVRPVTARAAPPPLPAAVLAGAPALRRSPAGTQRVPTLQEPVSSAAPAASKGSLAWPGRLAARLLRLTPVQARLLAFVSALVAGLALAGAVAIVQAMLG